ncbi:MAG TPA: PKD domain-containing protein [Candidatus Limnocylindrales bacterium]|nr:PKD domain-containing protein [Candidatus Limnocylindrales bacterium]
MSRRIASIAALAALLLGGLLPPATVGAADPIPFPDTMAAVGDSISQAASSDGSLGGDAPQNSWSTGTSSTVNSHYLRLLALGAPISGANHNFSVSGAKAAGLATQMQNVVNLKPDYLTVQIGGNDLCTDNVSTMTDVSVFGGQVQAALAAVTNGSPNTFIYVTSIPDAYQLWNLFKNDFWARFIWSVGGICQSLLANPTSTQQADVQRRLEVRQRNIDFNTALANACALTPRCRWDGNAVFNTVLTRNDVAGDYFHPSLSGQARLASGTWDAGYTWGTPTANEPPTASFTSACSGLVCTFTNTSTDGDGTITTNAWTFGDGGTSGAVSPTHTYAAGGTYAIGLSVTDDDGAATSTSASVTVMAPAAADAWVSDLAPTRAGTRNSWTATVTISVRDDLGPLAGAVVTGSWTVGSGATTCTTNGAGQCSLSSSSLNKKTASVTFSVVNLTKSGWTYASGRNTETSVTILKP